MVLKELAAEQQRIGEEVQRLVRNYKKDSSDRKTVQYFQKRIAQLQTFKESFEAVDDNIRRISNPPLDHPYFVEEYYNQICGIIDSYLAEFNLNLIDLEEQAAKEQAANQMVHEGTNTNLQHNTSIIETSGLIRRIKATINLLARRCLNTIQDNTEYPTKVYELKLKTINEEWKELQTLLLQMWDTYENPVIYGYDEERYLEVENTVNKVITTLSIKINSTVSVNKNDNLAQMSAVHLPKITIPKFSGDYRKWQQFNDLFSDMVDKQQIPNTQKMWYLTSSLSGEAANLISHLTITTDNYEIAWQTIKDRYDNKRAIVSSLIKSMVDQHGAGHKPTASATELQNIFDNIRECLLALKNLGINTETWGPLLLHVLLPKLDKQTRMLYEQTLDNPREVPEVGELLRFLEKRFQSLEVVGQNEKYQPVKSLASTVNQVTTNNCKLCKKTSHPLYKCEIFINKPISDRINIVRNFKVCFNCLRSGHSYNKCVSRSCLKCNKKHNTLLHQEDEAQQANIVAQSEQISLFSTSAQSNSYILLGTALINITAGNGEQIICRAILDSGSQVNLITERLVERLQLKTVPLKLIVEGIGHGKKSITSSITTTIHSRIGNYSTNLNALVISRITSKQPYKQFSTSTWKMPTNIPLADQQFNCPGDIDILLGAEFYHEIMLDGYIKLDSNLPSLQNTTFGWICIGKIEELHHSTATCGIFSENHDDLDVMLSKFWELEEIPSTTENMTDAETKCETMFVQNTKRNAEGRFIVEIPFIEDPKCLGNSSQQAINRFYNLEQRLNKQPLIKAQYIQFMRDYEKLGHMERINENDIGNHHYFIPHHCVLKPDSSTTKLRVVFDASAKTSSGFSLNDIMHKGPVVQSDLSSILMRFRMHRFVFTTDVEKMYRQILINEKHQQYQLIVWRENFNDKLETFRLKTVTYGTRSAPYLATRCLTTLADEYIKTYPLGARALQKDFYVDDGLSGADTMTEALAIKDELVNILATAGLKLRKWCANNAQLLTDTPQEDQEVELDFTKTETKTAIKTLGIMWLPKTDEFCIKTSSEFNATITKRIVTSELARIFDPLGLVAPVIIKAKIFAQKLWQEKLDWDDVLPAPLKKEWSQFRTNLQNLNNVKIPRHIMNHKQMISFQLHAFTDASTKAYGAAVYLRAINKDNTISTQLLCAKSRVAPLKTQTIPRLELCAALLGAELMHRVNTDLNAHNIKKFLWSDSEIVLYWINSTSTKFQTFVAHRVAKIQRFSVPKQWRHVSSKNNPADFLSRGMSSAEINNCSMWYHGPLFLYGNESQWPAEFNKDLMTHNLTEEQRIKGVLFTSHKQNIVNMIYNIKYKSFPHLQKIVGYVLRFIDATRHKQRTNNAILSPKELERATKIIAKAIQKDEFAEEIQHLSSKKSLSPNNALASLAPFIDSEGLIRVGGRLQESNLPFDAKHPILLPYNDPIVKSLMRHLHEVNLHCGPQALLANTRNQFWPIKGKIMARSIVQHCVRCTRVQPKLYNQIMGNLPKDRVQLQRPFFNSGVDFCGPIWVHYKLRGKRPSKAYICVFCCFSTKAVHLEIVSDLTTDAFLGALNRFISRRGRCQHLYCDNATNFVGAQRQLEKLEEMIYSSKAKENIAYYCAEKGIEFKFIPPRAPHFGGLWEAAVKSAKHLLIKEIGNASLTYEELETVVIQIEGILNSRPLTPMSSDPNDLSALTPGHFLIGEPLTAHPNVNMVEEKMSLLKRWNLVNYIKREFWTRWTKEYLNELQHRAKWKTNIRRIDNGTMVILKEDNLPPLLWPLGRIVKTYEGNDGNIRVVDVKTSNGIIRRPIHRLAPLFPQENENHLREKRPQTSISNTMDQAPENKSVMPKRPRLISSNMTVAIIAILLCLPLALGSFVKVTNFPNRIGLHFEDIGKGFVTSTQWNLLIYYDLHPLKREIATLEEGTTRLEKLCYLAKQRKLCNVLIMQLNESRKEFELDDRIFQLRRKKRGAIDIVGNVAHTLFGVLDSEYAEHMSQTIQDINSNEKSELDLIKNQTSIIDSTINIMKSNQIKLKEKFDIIDKTFNEINNTFQSEEHMMGTQETLQLLVMHLTFSIMKIYQVQTMILNVLTDAHHGQIGPLILSPDQLKKEISKIRDHLYSTAKLPVAQDDLLTLYKLMSIEAGLTYYHVLFKIAIPLIDVYDFNIYKLTPIPTVINETFVTIQPSFDILAITPHGDAYFPLTHEQHAACSKLSEQRYICPLIQSIHHKGSAVGLCEVNFYNNETNRPCEIIECKTDLWVQLNNKNHWLFAVKEPIKLTGVCGSIVEQITIRGSGLLNLSSECVLKNRLLTIHGQQNVTSIISSSFSTHANLSQLIDLNTSDAVNLMNVIKPYNTDLKELMNLQEELKHSQIFQLPKMRQQDNMHIFGIMYTLLIFTIIMSIYKVVTWYMRRSVKKAENLKPIPRPRQNTDDFTIRI